MLVYKEKIQLIENRKQTVINELQEFNKVIFQCINQCCQFESVDQVLLMKKLWEEIDNSATQRQWLYILIISIFKEYIC